MGSLPRGDAQRVQQYAMDTPSIRKDKLHPISLQNDADPWTTPILQPRISYRIYQSEELEQIYARNNISSSSSAYAIQKNAEKRL